MRTTTVSIVLDVFFAAQVAAVTGLRRHRVRAVETRLRDCLEAEGERVLEPRDRSLLAVERVLDPVDAFARSMQPADLASALPLFLGPRWLPRDAVEARCQVRTAERLAAHLVAHGLIDAQAMECALLELGALAERVRRDLAAAPRV